MAQAPSSGSCVEMCIHHNIINIVFISHGCHFCVGSAGWSVFSARHPSGGAAVDGARLAHLLGEVHSLDAVSHKVVTMSMSKSSKMLNYINCRMKVTIQDSRQLVGTFMAFDRHMNLVLGDTVEYRRVKAKKGSGSNEVREERRTLGLILLRGENVVSLQVEAPAPSAPSGGGVGVGAGRGVPAGRGIGGMGAAPAGLAGPMAGMGGPGAASMMPHSVAAAARPQAYARPPMPGMPMGMGPGRGLPPGVAPMGMGMMPGRGMPPGMAGMPRGMPPGVAPRGPM